MNAECDGYADVDDGNDDMDDDDDDAATSEGKEEATDEGQGVEVAVRPLSPAQPLE